MKEIIIASIIAFVAILFIALFILTAIAYKKLFGMRFATNAAVMLSPSDFSGLKRERREFISDKVQKIVGYLYLAEKERAKGVIVMAHGFGGGGHNDYMECADFFVKNGYHVFAYDATGNDESEGQSVVGLPQGLIDLDHAIKYVETQREAEGLPILLFGHSWGGYCAANALNFHPEVKGIVSLSGFNKSADIASSLISGAFRLPAKLFYPCVCLLERIKFGKYGAASAMKGFEKSTAAAMILHSKDDSVVGIGYGYDKYYEKYNGDPRFTFIEYADRGHNEVYYCEKAREYARTLYAEMSKNAKSGGETFDEYLSKNLDREIWTHRIDKELFGKILAFYDKCVK